MASGTYGIVRPADISPTDVEIFYHYTPSRDNIGDISLTKMDSTTMLFKVDTPQAIKELSNITTFQIFGGLYTLKLPTATFGKKGYYTIIIKPVEIEKKQQVNKAKSYRK